MLTEVFSDARLRHRAADLAHKWRSVNAHDRNSVDDKLVKYGLPRELDPAIIANPAKLHVSGANLLNCAVLYDFSLSMNGRRAVEAEEILRTVVDVYTSLDDDGIEVSRNQVNLLL